MNRITHSSMKIKTPESRLAELSKRYEEGKPLFDDERDWRDGHTEAVEEETEE